MKNKSNKQDSNKSEMPLAKKNYIMILIGVGVIILGFLLMIGGKSESPDQFNEAMFSARRIIVAPLVLLAGLMFEIYAIMKK